MGRKCPLFIASVGIHVFAAAALTIAGWWHIDRLELGGAGRMSGQLVATAGALPKTAATSHEVAHWNRPSEAPRPAAGGRHPSVEPSDETIVEMIDRGVAEINARLRTCVDEAGGVTRVTWLHRSGYVRYDRVLMRAVIGWHYQPFAINGTAVAACIDINIRYQLR